MPRQPLISVIIPLHNAAGFIGRCVEAVCASDYGEYEILVVDDCSADNGADIAKSKGTRVLKMESNSGPAAARNRGASVARGEILLFVDSDVIIEPHTLSSIASDFSRFPDIAAVFGSYDDNPWDKSFISQYKNLLHHFVHQNSNPDAGTFWAGCGAVRKQVFLEAGGFDEARYAEPSIEDIELGLRLRSMGYRILLDKNIQVQHLKKWSFGSLLKTDIFKRAVPWSRLILESGKLQQDLNLKLTDRLSTAVVGLMALAFPLSILNPVLLALIPICFLALFLLNYRLFRFFYRSSGLAFLTVAFFLHTLFYLYSGLTISACTLAHLLTRKSAAIGR